MDHHHLNHDGIHGPTLPLSRTYACYIRLLRLVPAGGGVIITDVPFSPIQTRLCEVTPPSLLIWMEFLSLSTNLQLASSQMKGNYLLEISHWLTFKLILSKPSKSGDDMKGQSG